MRLIYLLYTFILAHSWFITSGYCQEAKRTLLVKTRPGVVGQSTERMAVDAIPSKPLRELLLKHNGSSIEKVFKTFRPSDTLSVDRSGNPVKLIDLSTWYLVSFGAGFDQDLALDEIKTSDQVLVVEREATLDRTETFPDEIPLSDPDAQRLQWGLYNPDNRVGGEGHDINAPIAWDFQLGRNDIVVAVIDDAVDHNHLDLDPGDRSRVISGWNFYNGNSNTLPPYPSWDHGTMVSGVIGAITNNGMVYGENSVAGVMWNCKIMPFVAEDPTQRAKAIDWARSNGAHILNNSWRTFDATVIIDEAVYNAWASGLVVCASMGNDYLTNVPTFPAGYFGSMGIGATDELDNWLSYSNAGNFINLAAPGAPNRTIYPNGSYTMFSQTSLSTAFVSGAAGLVWSEGLDLGMNLDADEIQGILEATANKVPEMQGLPWTDRHGYGRMDIGKAMKRINIPYEISRATLTGGSVVMTRDDHQREFIDNYYLGGLDNQNYFCEQYKVTWQVSFPEAYAEPPYVIPRYRAIVGWWGDDGAGTDPVSEVPWVEIVRRQSLLDRWNCNLRDGFGRCQGLFVL